MPERSDAERPAERRPFAFGDWTHWALALAAAPLFAAFVWQHGLASLGDDSVSYLVVAHWLSGRADALLAPWVPWHTHFPPAFPIVLAVTGSGIEDLLPAHLAVAAFGALAVGMFARHVALRLESPAAGALLALAFLATPTAWVSLKGVLSESLYLVLTLGALHLHAVRLERAPAQVGSYLALGLLLAAAYLTRAIGLMLVVAFVARTVVEFAAGRDRRAAPWTALAPVALLAGAWMLARPGGHGYGLTSGKMIASWLSEPAVASHAAYVAFSSGWLASFMTESTAPALQGALLAGLGALAAAGALRATARNRLDGWYVLFSAALIFAWPFGENNTRRLLYPLIPLALLHAAETAWMLAGRFRIPLRGPIVAAVLAAPMLPCVPSLALVFEKAFDRAPLIEGSRYSAADIAQYYTTVNVARARAIAGKHAAVLGGLEQLSADTPPGARVMWLRPEYVVLLGKREGVAAYFDWDPRRIAREVRDARVAFIVVAGLYKSDLRQQAGDPATSLAELESFSRRRTVIANPVTRDPEYILLEVDRQALEEYLARE